MNSKEWKKWIFWFSFAVASIIVYKTIDSFYELLQIIFGFFRVLMPFIMASLFAYILYMPCKKLESLINKTKLKFIVKHSRGLSVLIVYVFAGLLIYSGIQFILPSLSHSVIELANNIPNYYTEAINYFNNLDEESILVKFGIVDYIRSLSNIRIENILISTVSLDNIQAYIKGITSATGFIFDSFVTLVVSIYILMERSDIKSFCQNLGKATLDKKTYDLIGKYYKKTNGIFFNYIASQLLDAFVVGIIVSIAMTLMKVKYAVLLGVLIGTFNIIPYFGAIVAVFISIVITIFTGGIIQAVELAIVVIALQQIDANIINPRILGSSLNLSPILIIFAVTIGGTYFGVLGMFLGVPVVAFFKIVLGDFIDLKLNKNEINQ